jgi:putative ABC transport system permease protein
MGDLPANPALALRLAWGSLCHHRMMAAATVLGVALGMMVVSAILVVDHNTFRPPPETVEAEGGGTAARAVRRRQLAPFIQRVWFIRASAPAARPPPLLPTQRGQAAAVPPPGAGKKSSRGAEDYAAMRLAARLASLLAFFVGAVIVFCTMRYAVMARAREFSLLLCLGESRANAALSLAVEAALLGVVGTALGLAAALPAAQALLALGISTTGQTPLSGFVVPGAELAAMAAISISFAMLGVVAPARSLLRLNVAAILQPRFLTTDGDARDAPASGFGWLLPPLIAASYLVARPFLISWLSVIQFFLFEAAFVCLLAAATLWWVTPLLRGVIRLTETALRPLMPLEVLLAGRRLRLASHRITFSVIGVTLVFGLLTGLHGITRALKDEIHLWSSRAQGNRI